MSVKDGLRFAKACLKSPKQISAIAPSSRFLAEEITKDLSHESGPVIEFGPGTGVFTRRVLARGTKAENLHLVEMDAGFCKDLAKRFPGVHIHQKSATDLTDLPIGKAGAVISGLPILSMPVDVQEDILRAAMALLGPGGTYYQFTYGRRPPFPPELLEKYGVSWSKGARVWRNLPPATVYSFLRKKDFPLSSQEYP